MKGVLKQWQQFKWNNTWKKTKHFPEIKIKNWKKKKKSQQQLDLDPPIETETYIVFKID